MRKPMIAGNWKMNGTKATIAPLVEAIKAGYTADNPYQCILIPPYAYLNYVACLLDGTAIHLGAQTLNEHENGAYTGEIAAKMLLDVGCSHVLVGHSERRTLFGESNAVVSAKFKAAKDAQLVPILCVGETLEQREAGEVDATIKAQIQAVIIDSPSHLEGAVIAYEPVWAIGTGKTATPEQAQEVHAMIRAYIADFDEKIADNLCILYGGSVKSANAATLLAQPDIDGGLIGGASLDAAEFLAILKS